VYGRLTDKQVYDGILNCDYVAFAGLVEEIAQSLLDSDTRLIAGDEMEGYNPGHDLCRVLTDCAVELAQKRSGNQILNLSFPLVAAPGPSVDGQEDGWIRLELDPETFAGKVEAARRYQELSTEVDRAFLQNGKEAFRTEWLSRVTNTPTAKFELPPYYERYGEEQVRQGYYKRVLRYREHFLPLVESLRRHITGRRVAGRS
jgi:hypothetical protein